MGQGDSGFLRPRRRVLAGPRRRSRRSALRVQPRRSRRSDLLLPAGARGSRQLNSCRSQVGSLPGPPLRCVRQFGRRGRRLPRPARLIQRRPANAPASSRARVSKFSARIVTPTSLYSLRVLELLPRTVLRQDAESEATWTYLRRVRGDRLQALGDRIAAPCPRGDAPTAARSGSSVCPRQCTPAGVRDD